MEIPIIIAARNEELHIGSTLDALSRQDSGVEPVIVVNGSTDATADIARQAGARVIESDEGKMIAIQAGLRHLGKKSLGPLLILDSDSRPMFKGWSSRLTGELTQLPVENPAIVWGPYIFNGEINPVLGLVLSATSMQVSWADRNSSSPRTVRGGNTGLRLDMQTLERLLSLENYWPREDVAIFDTLKEGGGNKKVVFHPEAWVKSSGHRATTALKRIIKERRDPNAVYDELYAADAPPNSRPYDSPYHG